MVFYNVNSLLFSLICSVVNQNRYMVGASSSFA